MIALGSNVHIFARPNRRDELTRCFEMVLHSPARTVELPGIDRPVLVVSWLELRAEDPAAVHQTVLEAGLTEVKHPGHPYYFMIPGGQVFTIAPAS